MTYQYIPTLSAADTSKVSGVMWVYISSDAAAASEADPNGPGLPLFLFGKYLKDTKYKWTGGDATDAFFARPDLFGFGGSDAPLPPYPVWTTCQPGVQQVLTRRQGWIGPQVIDDASVFFVMVNGQPFMQWAPNLNNLLGDPHARFGEVPPYWVQVRTNVWFVPGLPCTPSPNGVSGAPDARQGYANPADVINTQFVSGLVYFPSGSGELDFTVCEAMNPAWDATNPNDTVRHQTFFTGSSSGIALDDWNVILFAIDTSGATSDLWQFRFNVNAVNRSFDGGGLHNFTAPLVAAVNGLQAGVPIIPNEIGNWDQSGLNQLLQYSLVQVWYDQFIDDTTENLSKFFTERDGFLYPVGGKVAADFFGVPDVWCERDNLSGFEFEDNQGTAGDFEVVGTEPKDVKPNPTDDPVEIA